MTDKEKIKELEAQLQALQKYIRHLDDCRMSPQGRVLAAWNEYEIYCTCGLASLTQPGAANKTKVSEE